MVTKFFPVSDVRLLADLGVTDVGENRHQEAEAKAAECADLDLLALHRRLQRNKAAAVGGYAAVVHSVDRRKLVAALSTGARTSVAPVDVCSRSASTRRAHGPDRRGPRRPRRPGGRGRRGRHARGCAA